MSLLRVILRSLVHHWPLNVAVALGVVAGTAVLTGALLVGDSVRGSLRDLTLQRLGRVDELLATGRFFRAELAGELEAEEGFDEHYDAALPVVMLRGTVEHTDSGRQASRVNVLGSDERFWQLGEGGPPAPPQGDEIVLNGPLADDLGAKTGDEVVIRLPLPADIPPDSPLGKKTGLIQSTRLAVSAIIPAEGLGRFDTQPNQALPRNAYVPLERLQRALDRPGGANAIFVAGKDIDTPPRPEAHEALQEMLDPRLEDYGLKLERVERAPVEIDGRQVGGTYFNLTSENMLLEDYVVRQALEQFAERNPQPAFTYLANTIACGGQEIPYSTITGIDSTPELGPLFTTQSGEPRPLEIPAGQIVLNRWAADDLRIEEGKAPPVTVTYFRPETTHRGVEEETTEFKLHSIAPFATEEGEAPELTNDPQLTPELKGVTDKLSIGDWDPPFPFDDDRVRPEDERYWEDYRATPKGFISLEQARELWGSRFGDTTSIRIPAAGEPATAAEMAKRLELEPARLGFTFQPIKRLGLEASQGTTSFSGLFIGFSFFIIASAVMLVALLFRLGVERRADQVGITLASGFPFRRVAAMLAGEAAVIALAGGVVGVAAGVGYAWLMLTGLTTWWLEAITTPFLTLHVTALSLVIGYVSGVAVSLLAILWTLWRMRRIPVRRLLANQATEASELVRGKPRIARWVALAGFVLALGLGVVALTQQGMAQTGAFFGAGALMLVAGLAVVWSRLRYGSPGTVAWTSRTALANLAVRNGARNPGRSTLTIGLVASASFLIVALSAFQMDPSQASPRKESGNGGFDLVAQTDQPLYENIATAEGRRKLFSGTQEVKEQDLALLEKSRIFSFRVRPGDDASCLNLYQSRNPRVLGVPEGIVERGGFLWSDTMAETEAEEANPWLLLEKDLGTTEGGERIVPVVIDMNTAIYSLHLSGAGDIYDQLTDAKGNRITLQVVGLLSNSILQGDLLVSEEHFLELFPEISGWQFFLIDSPPASGRPVPWHVLSELGQSRLTEADQDLLFELSFGEFDQEAWKQALEKFQGDPAHARAMEVFRTVTDGEAISWDREKAAAWLAAFRMLEEERESVDSLVRILEDPAEADALVLKRQLGDYGFDAQTAAERLAGFLAVQNTYISTFQSLGGLGLLLGTFGLAVVQLRNVLERRGELALLRATGFRRSRLARMVMLENVLLLLGGLGTGVVAAAVAVLPHFITGGAAVPAWQLALTLGIVLIVGLIAGSLAVRAVLRVPLLAALRGD